MGDLSNIYGAFIEVRYLTAEPFNKIVVIRHFEQVETIYLDILWSGKLFFILSTYIVVSFIKYLFTNLILSFIRFY